MTNFKSVKNKTEDEAYDSANGTENDVYFSHGIILLK